MLETRRALPHIEWACDVHCSHCSRSSENSSYRLEKSLRSSLYSSLFAFKMHLILLLHRRPLISPKTKPKSSLFLSNKDQLCLGKFTPTANLLLHRCPLDFHRKRNQPLVLMKLKINVRPNYRTWFEVKLVTLVLRTRPAKLRLRCQNAFNIVFIATVSDVRMHSTLFS